MTYVILEDEATTHLNVRGGGDYGKGTVSDCFILGRKEADREVGIPQF